MNRRESINIWSCHSMNYFFRNFILLLHADDSSSKQPASRCDTTQSKFGFINSSTDEGNSTATDQVPSHKTQPDINAKTGFDIDLNLDLGLDFELDPLRSKSQQDLCLKGRGGLDLEGIDFSSDLDLSISKEDSDDDDDDDEDIRKRLDKLQKDDRDVENIKQEHGIDDRCSDKSFKQRNTEVCDDGEDKDEKYMYNTLQMTKSNEHEKTTADNFEEQIVNRNSKSKFGFISGSSLTGNSAAHDAVSSRDHQKNFTEGEFNIDPEDLSDDVCLDAEAERAGGNVMASSSLYDLELDVGEMLEVLQEAHAAAEQQMRYVSRCRGSSLFQYVHRREFDMMRVIFYCLQYLKERRKKNETHV